MHALRSDLPRVLAERIGDATSVYPAGTAPLVARAAEALRRLATAGVDPYAALSPDVVVALEVLADATGAVRSRFGNASTRDDGLATFPMGTHPVLGRGNTIAAPIEVDLVGDVLVGRARYGPLYEGLPGSVFGGFVAAGFDALLGVRAALVGAPCSAAQLTTRFLAPTPLHVEVRYEAELEGIDERKISVHGRLLDDCCKVTAESDAVFLAVSTDAVTTEHVTRQVRTE